MAAICAVLVTALAAGSLAAQDRLTITEMAFEPAEAAPGDEVTLVVKGEVEQGYHIYGAMNAIEPTKLRVDDAAGLTAIGGPRIPAGVPHKHLGENQFWVEGTATFRQKFKVPAGMAAGDASVAAVVAYMACTPQFCDPPAEASISATLKVKGGPEPSPVPDAGSGFQDPIGFGFPGADPQTPLEALAGATARFEPAQARAGDKVTLIVDVEIIEGWHVYGGMREYGGTTVEVEAEDVVRATGVLIQPPGTPHDDGLGGNDIWLEGAFELRREYTVFAEEAGAREVAVDLSFMPCDISRCLDAGVANLTATFEVLAGGEVGEEAIAAAAAAVAPQLGPEESSILNSWWALIIAAIGGGLFALAMPCTYPMIPITFSFFTKQAENRGGSVLPLALTYGAGIVAMFILVGLLLGGVIIEFASGWGINAVFFAAFVIFAFALFGWIEINPPQFLMNASAKASTTGGLLGVFLMGATLVITSFTCTAPIAGSLLTQAAKGGETSRVAIGMAVFGLTIALPFVILALMPGKVKAMPKSGEWMYTLKVTLGFIELAAALKFLSMVEYALAWNVLPREYFLLALIVIFVLCSLFLFGAMRGPGQPLMGVSKVRHGFAIGFLALAGWFIYGLAGHPMDFVSNNFLPPYSLADIGKARHAIVKDDFDTALALAQEEDKLLLVNITGFQ